MEPSSTGGRITTIYQLVDEAKKLANRVPARPKGLSVPNLHGFVGLFLFGTSKGSQGYGLVQNSSTYGKEMVLKPMDSVPEAIFTDCEARDMAESMAETHAEAFMARVDINSVYAQIEARIPAIMRKFPAYNNYLKQAITTYMPHGTLCVGYDEALKQTVVRICKEFVVRETATFLINGYPTKNAEMVGKVFKDPLDQAAYVLAFGILHECGHKVFRHLNEAGGLYHDFPRDVINDYGDQVVNLNLTKQLLGSGEPEPALIPPLLFGKEKHYVGYINSPAECVKLLQSTLRERGFPIVVDARVTKEAPDERASLVYRQIPTTIVGDGAATAVIIKLYESIVGVLLKCGKLEKASEVAPSGRPDPQGAQPSQPAPAPEVPKIEAFVGQIVGDTKTRKIGVVVRLVETPLPDGTKSVTGAEVAWYDSLPPDVQEKVDRAITPLPPGESLDEPAFEDDKEEDEEAAKAAAKAAKVRAKNRAAAAAVSAVVAPQGAAWTPGPIKPTTGIDQTSDLRNGDEVQVFKGRKVPISTEGRVFWTGPDNYNPSKTRVGIMLSNGNKVYTSRDNLIVTRRV